MRYQELARRLRALGCLELRAAKGSHQMWTNPATDLQTVVNNWGQRDLKPGTVRAIIRQLGISREEFGPIK